VIVTTIFDIPAKFAGIFFLPSFRHFNQFMNIQVTKTNSKEIHSLRSLFLQENNFQFIYNKCHLYGWADVYVFSLGAVAFGYGAIWGQNNRADRDAIFEFYIVKPFRKLADECFLQLKEVSRALCIECQSNDRLLSSMLYQYTKNIIADRILFEDQFETNMIVPGLVFSKQEAKSSDSSDERSYSLKQANKVVATGGFLLNYNEPFADLHMEVSAAERRKGLGTYMIQELKKTCYLLGRVPAARCNIDNKASKATLLKAGMGVCGYILVGKI
jgi:hypothetical protein